MKNNATLDLRDAAPTDGAGWERPLVRVNFETGERMNRWRGEPVEDTQTTQDAAICELWKVGERSVQAIAREAEVSWDYAAKTLADAGLRKRNAGVDPDVLRDRCKAGGDAAGAKRKKPVDICKLVYQEPRDHDCTACMHEPVCRYQEQASAQHEWATCRHFCRVEPCVG